MTERQAEAWAGRRPKKVEHQSLTASAPLHHFCEFLMDLVNNASDDQIAAIGCALAFVVSGGLMYVSFFVGQMGKKSDESSTVAFKTAENTSQSANEADRKAA